MAKSRPIIIKKTSYGFQPADGDSEYRLSEMAIGAEFKLTSLRKRSNPQNSLYWCVLTEIIKATGSEKTPENLHDMLKIELGHGIPVKLSTGELVLIPDSTSFGKMDDEKFNDYVDRAFKALTERFGYDVLASYYEITGQNGGEQFKAISHETNDNSDSADTALSADAPEESCPSVRHSGALNHLAGEQRDLLLKFTREYYWANTQTSRVSIEDRYYKKVSEHEDVWDLAVRIAALIKSRNIPELLNFIGRDEAWLKSAEAA